MKKAPLQCWSLCKKGLIPVEYHEFYETLTANNCVKERLPESDGEGSLEVVVTNMCI